MTSLGCFSSLGRGDVLSNISGFYDLIYAVVPALTIAVGAALTASIRITAMPIGSHISI